MCGPRDIPGRDYTPTMMTSSNGNIFRVTGPLCGEFTGPGEFPTQRPVTRSFDDFFYPRLNKRLSKQPWGWWFETPTWSLWRQCNDPIVVLRVVGHDKHMWMELGGAKYDISATEDNKQNHGVVGDIDAGISSRKTNKLRFYRNCDKQEFWLSVHLVRTRVFLLWVCCLWFVVVVVIW